MEKFPRTGQQVTAQRHSRDKSRIIAICDNCGLKLDIVLDSCEGMDYRRLLSQIKPLRIVITTWDCSFGMQKKERFKIIKDDEKDKTDAKAENTGLAEAGS